MTKTLIQRIKSTAKGAKDRMELELMFTCASVSSLLERKSRDGINGNSRSALLGACRMYPSLERLEDSNHAEPRIYGSTIKECEARIYGLQGAGSDEWYR